MEFWKAVWEISVGMGFGMFAYIFLAVLFWGVPEVLRTLEIIPPRPDGK